MIGLSESNIIGIEPCNELGTSVALMERHTSRKTEGFLASYLLFYMLGRFRPSPAFLSPFPVAFVRLIVDDRRRATVWLGKLLVKKLTISEFNNCLAYSTETAISQSPGPEQSCYSLT